MPFSDCQFEFCVVENRVLCSEFDFSEQLDVPGRRYSQRKRLPQEDSMKLAFNAGARAVLLLLGIKPGEKLRSINSLPLISVD